VVAQCNALFVGMVFLCVLTLGSKLYLIWMEFAAEGSFSKLCVSYAGGMVHEDADYSV
jgi:hypothetical protein